MGQMSEGSHPILTDTVAPPSESHLHLHTKIDWILPTIGCYTKYVHPLVANEPPVVIIHSDEGHCEVTENDLGEGRVYGFSSLLFHAD